MDRRLLGRTREMVSTLAQLEENVALASPLVPLSSGEEERLLADVRPLARAENMWWRQGPRR